jgi:hypothetical protein
VDQRRAPSPWEQLLFWPHRPPDRARYDATQALRSGRLPADPRRAASALRLARRSLRMWTTGTGLVVAVTLAAVLRLITATGPGDRLAPATVTACGLYATVLVVRAWRRRQRALLRLAARAARPVPHGPVITVTS